MKCLRSYSWIVVTLLSVIGLFQSSPNIFVGDDFVSTEFVSPDGLHSARVFATAQRTRIVTRAKELIVETPLIPLGTNAHGLVFCSAELADELPKHFYRYCQPSFLGGKQSVFLFNWQTSEIAEINFLKLREGEIVDLDHLKKRTPGSFEGFLGDDLYAWSKGSSIILTSNDRVHKVFDKQDSGLDIDSIREIYRGVFGGLSPGSRLFVSSESRCLAFNLGDIERESSTGYWGKYPDYDLQPVQSPHAQANVEVTAIGPNCELGILAWDDDPNSRRSYIVYPENPESVYELTQELLPKPGQHRRMQ